MSTKNGTIHRIENGMVTVRWMKWGNTPMEASTAYVGDLHRGLAVGDKVSFDIDDNSAIPDPKDIKKL